jgi:hypothetical protein
MASDLIRYDLLVQDALRGVMRKVLADAAEAGNLPGDHHFTISFRTNSPGVRLSRRLAEQWPNEMTIILQHQYSNLFVDEKGFGVTLSFRFVPEQLYVPFDAVTVFSDPSVEFGLKFEIAEEDGEDEADEEKGVRPGPHLVRDDEASQASPPPPALKPALAKAEPVSVSSASEPEAPQDDAHKIVSIDAFRKKT